MPLLDTDRSFAGSIPHIYESHMVPLLFESYAADLAARAAMTQPTRVLEIAAGTGVVTRQLVRALAPDAAIVATDLNQAMLDHAVSIGTERPVQWQQADAMQLPFPDASFDAVLCQFGVMFVPDKAAAFAEARRVLRPGGLLIFNAWDSLAHNEFAAVANQSLTTRFADDPPRFMARTPHGYHDVALIAQDLSRGGFSAAPRFNTLTHRSRAASARIPAVALCQGTPLRGEILARNPAGLQDATDCVTAALVARFGDGPVDGKMQAHVVSVAR